MPDPYLSELRYQGNNNTDFVEVAVDAGTDVSTIQVVIYNPNGTIRSVTALGTPETTEAGRDVYLINTSTTASFTGINQNGAVALVVDGAVTQFVSFEREVDASEGAAAGTRSTQIGTTGQGGSLETLDDGGSYQVQANPTPGNVPCFLAGSLILTERGACPVETLRTGDLVVTADQGLQPVLWAGHRALSEDDLRLPKLRPLCIPANALSRGVPSRDLYVSPNHRMALLHPLADVCFGAAECLIAAKHLVGWPGSIPHG